MAAHICIFFNRQVVVEVPEAIHDEMMLEVNKSKLRLGLHKAFMNALTTVRNKVHVVTEPTKGVFLKAAVTANQLKLVPLSMACTAVKSSSGIIVDHNFGSEEKPMQLVIQQPRFIEPDADDKGVVIPFFYVRPTPDASAANVELTFITTDGINIPALVNTSALKIGEELRLYKPGEKRELENPANPKGKRAKGKGKGKKGTGKGK